MTGTDQAKALACNQVQSERQDLRINRSPFWERRDRGSGSLQRSRTEHHGSRRAVQAGIQTYLDKEVQTLCFKVMKVVSIVGIRS